MKVNCRVAPYALGILIALDFILSGLLGWLSSPLYSMIYLGFVFILVLIRSQWGIIFLIAVQTLDTITLFSLRPYQWLLLLSLASYFIWQVFAKEGIVDSVRKLYGVLRKQAIKNKALFVFPVLLGLLLVASTLGIVNSSHSVYSLKQTGVLGMCLAIALAVYAWIISKKNGVAAAVKMFILSSVPVALFALYQNIAHEYGWQSFEVFAARPNGSFYEPDWLGMYEVLVLAFLLPWLMLRPMKHIDRIGWGMLAVLNMIVLVITVARASWLGFAAAAAVMIGFAAAGVLLRRLKRKDFIKITASAAGSFLVLAFALTLIVSFKLTRFNLWDRVESIYKEEHIITVAERDYPYEKKQINLEEIEQYRNLGYRVYEEKVTDENVSARYEAFSSNKEIVSEHPILGQGQGSVLARTNYVDNANNIFYEWWISAGLAGLAVFIVLLGYPLVQIGKMIALVPEETHKKLAFYMAAVLGIVAFAVANVFNSGIFFVPLWVFLGIVYGGLAGKAIGLTKNE